MTESWSSSKWLTICCIEHKDAIKMCRELGIYKDEETKEHFGDRDDIPEAQERNLSIILEKLFSSPSSLVGIQNHFNMGEDQKTRLVFSAVTLKYPEWEKLLAVVCVNTTMIALDRDFWNLNSNPKITVSILIFVSMVFVEPVYGTWCRTSPYMASRCFIAFAMWQHSRVSRISSSLIFYKP